MATSDNPITVYSLDPFDLEWDQQESTGQAFTSGSSIQVSCAAPTGKYVIAGGAYSGDSRVALTGSYPGGGDAGDLDLPGEWVGEFTNTTTDSFSCSLFVHAISARIAVVEGTS